MFQQRIAGLVPLNELPLVLFAAGFLAEYLGSAFRWQKTVNWELSVMIMTALAFLWTQENRWKSSFR